MKMSVLLVNLTCVILVLVLKKSMIVLFTMVVILNIQLNVNLLEHVLKLMNLLNVTKNVREVINKNVLLYLMVVNKNLLIRNLNNV